MPSPITVSFLEMRPLEAARILEQESAQELALFFREVPPAVVARTLRNLTPTKAAGCLEHLGGEGASILRQMPTGIVAALLRRLDAGRRTELVDAIPHSASLSLRLALRYPGGTVGSVLDPHVLTAYDHMTVADLVRLARGAPEQLLEYVYVLDGTQRLVGALNTHQCLIAKKSSPIGSLCGTNPISLRARGSLQEAWSHTGWARFSILPVVDREQIFLGIVRRREIGASSDARGEPVAKLQGALMSLAELYWKSSVSTFLGPGDRQSAAKQ